MPSQGSLGQYAKVLLNPGPCIHYIWSPTDPAFTISGLPQYTENMEMQLF
ncbi:unnamed protein product [Staurois parvus]|uniref:Uncharacterized protein n=1 Tax=Staurois parvus TaxID=386267 RepID=A0ABN9BPG4_9NEOB|nr:unnamed protein product [Staurois parvus]